MNIPPLKRNCVAIGPYRLSMARGGHGPSIVLLHGIPTHGFLWREVAPRLVETGFEVTVFDLLGYGDSDKPVDADLGIAAQARYIVDALEEVGWRGGYIVGHDIGGGIAQLIALANPNVITGLVLIDTIAYDSFPEPGIARLKEPVWDDILTAPDFDLKKGFAKGLMRGVVHADRVTTALIDAYERPFRGVEGRKAYLRAARALRTEDLASRMVAIENLPVPTLVIWGERDVFQPITYGQRLAEAMTDARLEIVADAGHFLPEDAPEFLAELIVKFTTPSQGA